MSTSGPAAAAHHPTRAAIVVPGGNYTADGPLLNYAAHAAGRRSAHVHRITWSPPARRSPATAADSPTVGPAGPEYDRWAAYREWVNGQATDALSQVTAATGVTAPVLLAKSLGSLAAPLAARRGLPAVWFTPLLTDPSTVAALRRAAAPCLLIGGTADTFWDGPAARSITTHVLEIDGAGHNMLVPGPLAASAAILGRVTTAVERFLDQEAWPA